MGASERRDARTRLANLREGALCHPRPIMTISGFPRARRENHPAAGAEAGPALLHTDGMLADRATDPCAREARDRMPCSREGSNSLLAAAVAWPFMTLEAGVPRCLSLCCHSLALLPWYEA